MLLQLFFSGVGLYSRNLRFGITATDINMKQLLLFILAFLLFSCSKPDDTTPVNSIDNIIGTWRLITYCKPVSSSACTTVTVPSGKNVFVSFSAFGSFKEYYENTKPAEYSFLGGGNGGFKADGNDIRITTITMSSKDGLLVNVVSITKDRLVLNPNGAGDYVFVRN